MSLLISFSDATLLPNWIKACFSISLFITPLRVCVGFANKSNALQHAWTIHQLTQHARPKGHNFTMQTASQLKGFRPLYVQQGL